MASLIDLEGCTAPPFEPPIGTYVEEVMMGVRHGAGDRKRTPPSSCATNLGSDVSKEEMIHMLEDALLTEPGLLAGQQLFWLALHGIFNRFVAEALHPLRCVLGKQWHLLTLEVEQRATNKKCSDWVMEKMPIALAQVIYRLLCDAFREDRGHLISQGPKLVLKLTLVVLFEVNGFLLTAETARKARHRFFLGRLISNPHVNQLELSNGQKRQEQLESQATGADRCLSFGRIDGHGMDEMQLEDVLKGRADAKSQQLSPNASRRGKGASEIPPELSVDRYESLASGASLLAKHLEALWGEPGQPANGAGDAECDIQLDLPPFAASPLLPSGPSLGEPGPGPTSPARSCASEMEEPRPSTGASKAESDLDMTRKSTATSRSRRGKEQQATALLRKQQEEAKIRRQRQDAFFHQVAEEPLRKEYSSTELDTAWVSQTMTFFVGDGAGRGLLHKTRAESRLLKRETHLMRARTLSMPALKTLKQSGSASTPDRRRALDAMAVSQQSGKESGTGSSLWGGGRPNTAATTSLESSVGLLPMSAGSHMGAGRSGGQLPPKQLMLSGFETDLIKSPKGKAIVRLLEAEAKACRQQSFAHYIHEHDIFTGLKKLTFDEKRLRDEEDATLKKLESLSKGRPCRMIPPASMVKAKEEKKGIALRPLSSP